MRTRKNDGVDLVVLLELPDEELGEVARVDELAEGLASSRDDKRRVVLWCSAKKANRRSAYYPACSWARDRTRRTLGQQALVHETWDDVTVLEGVVVVGSKDVGGDGGGEVAPELLIVGATGPDVSAAESAQSTLSKATHWFETSTRRLP